MNASASDLWPWFAVAGLGAFHGVNPAMGWLFAVALGLHRGSAGAVVTALGPIALGHAAAVAATLAAVLGIGAFVDGPTLKRLAGAFLIAWAVRQALYGHLQTTRFGMRIGLAGLFAWSALMASTHGAGLMLVPAVLPLCGPASAGGAGGGAWFPALAAVGVHTAAMLAVIGAVALVVYACSGLELVRRGWINFDWLWTAALAGSGGLLIASA